MTLTRRIDFDEPIPRMIERLRSEHVMFESKLLQIENNLKRNDIKQAAQIVQGISDKIIQHAVEEEARLMRVIMYKAKDESTEPIKIMQEHNWILNFLKTTIITVKKASTSSDPNVYEQAKEDLNEFVNNIRKHFEEEEQIVFPLTLRAEAVN